MRRAWFLVIAGLVGAGLVAAALWWPSPSKTPPASAQAPATQMQIGRLTTGVALHPDPSPDGKLVAVRYGSGAISQGWIAALLPISGGKAVRTLPLSRDAEGPLRWSPDGKALTYVAHREGAWNLWALPVDGGKPRPITNFPSERIFDFAWGRSRKQLALVRGLLARDAYVVRDFR